MTAFWGLIKENYTWLFSGLGVFLIAGLFPLFWDRYFRKTPAPLIKRIFDQSDSTEFRTCIESLIRQSHRLVLIGTGLNIL